MALTIEIMGGRLIDGPSKMSMSRGLGMAKKSEFLASPVLVPLQGRRRQERVRGAVKGPVAAIREDIIKATSYTSLPEKAVRFKVRALVTVRNKHREDLKETIVKQLDALTDNIGRNVVLQLISTEVDPKSKEPKRSREAALRDWSKKSNIKAERVHYTAEFTVDSDFGVPGAITVSNKHQREFFLETITIDGFACCPVHFPCSSWVQSRKHHPSERIFFSNKPYLPSKTPAGLRALREKELRNLRGDGEGVRKMSDRIYDFDVYNDLGNPDKGNHLVRPTLGGKAIPYPRRCRTGRPPMDSDTKAESRVEKPTPLYVPRDEQFEESKQLTFSNGRLRAVLHTLIPAIKASISADNQDFSSFSDIDVLYKEGLLLKVGLQDEIWKNLPLLKAVSKMQESGEGQLKYDTPKILSRDKLAWLRDDEFAREAVSGINPVSIERLRVFPPKSNLDPEIYGPLESALKEEHILGHLNGLSVSQALEENKLFMIDYHDVYLPFLDRINALDGRKAYATRPNSRSKRVVTPPVDATGSWIWQLAKAHVCSNDASVHQLVHHWLRTHASLEPFILAAHRQLSAMHPVFKLLDPHMRYTLEINALARQNLINGDGVIESCFTPGQYSMEISAAAYKNFWRFDKESLHADLIRRGMAVPDPSQPHGLKLLLEDYPYAQDGLLIWSAIESWVRTYVEHYYPNSSTVCNDRELQAWYSEAINVGHFDLRDADWWPKLATSDDLIWILTVLIWLASAQHAALNFGQYSFGGYVPNRPALMRRLIPEENDPEYANFLADPQKYFLLALPNVLQGTKLMAVIETLSTHSPDEEYIGERQQPSIWTGDAEMIEAFYDFSAEIREIEKEINRRNADPSLKHRCGAGVLPYELLAPTSGPGVTCRGVPNSVTI
ncbi:LIPOXYGENASE 3 CHLOROPLASTIC [Salix koriyanagi]|uniref:Lipoxygenase n=1 Tax=Salix koriyanagi TaxID=2511006 RepID=A0A9Q0T0H5_9ROSI|nr:LIPOXYGENASE 3 CHLOROPLASTIC [Salix koriyanagi]